MPRAVLDAFWRALADTLRPRMLALTLLPLAILLALVAGVAHVWGDALLAAADRLLSATLMRSDWWSRWAGGGFQRMALGVLMLLALSVPAIVVLALLLVSLIVAPVALRRVAVRRFAGLARRGRASVWASVGVSLGASALAGAAFVLTLPLWLVPGLVLVLPPLIWGWLACRVLAFDALAEHASAHERRALMRAHRVPLLLMGMACGWLGAAPGLMWMSGLLFAALFWLLVPLAIWVHTLVFTFSSLWFAHYGLRALQVQREEQAIHGPSHG
ncbi:MAG: EI24 domain-containing protein [Pseudomonadota bacterium]|nr:EI24 domain-containing protein [Pseudomonadota bacterium]